jgi:dual specificity MAP kinase phosphatase
VNDPEKLDLKQTVQKLEVLHERSHRADEAGVPNRVLVYCMSGTSRAPSVAVAYLMHSERRRLADAMSALARRYPRGHRGIVLKPNDYAHLEDFERQLFPETPVNSGAVYASRGPAP